MKCPSCKKDLIEEGIVQVISNVSIHQTLFFNEDLLEFEYDFDEKGGGELKEYYCNNCGAVLELPITDPNDEEFIKAFIKDNPKLMKKFIQKKLSKVVD